jgi:hypothetical protein
MKYHDKPVLVTGLVAKAEAKGNVFWVALKGGADKEVNCERSGNRLTWQAHRS